MWWGHLVGKRRVRGICCNVLGRCDIGDDEGETFRVLTCIAGHRRWPHRIVLTWTHIWKVRVWKQFSQTWGNHLRSDQIWLYRKASCSVTVPAGMFCILSHQTFQPVWLNSSRWNNPRGCITADPQSPSITTTKIPEIKKGIEQKENRKNNDKTGWMRGNAGRKAVWLAGGKGWSGLSSVWQRTQGKILD